MTIYALSSGAGLSGVAVIEYRVETESNINSYEKGFAILELQH